jgi:hypothetical protein
MAGVLFVSSFNRSAQVNSLSLNLVKESEGRNKTNACPYIFWT